MPSSALVTQLFSSLGLSQLPSRSPICADEDLAHVSPLLHRHVIPSGTYSAVVCPSPNPAEKSCTYGRLIS